MFEALEKGIGTMSFTINRQHYEIFTEIANETGWPAARKPRSWAQGVGAEERFLGDLKDEKVNRAYLTNLCADSSVSPESCFLSIMAWGGMKYDHGQIAWKLHEDWSIIVTAIREGRLSREEAYERFHQFRKKHPRCGFGPAYWTKLIFFASPKHDGYIMDQWTSVSINLLLQNYSKPIVDLSSGNSRGQTYHHVTDRNDATVFETFCSGVEHLARQSDLQHRLAINTPEDVEMRMFSFGGKRPGAWRRYVKQTPQPT